MLKAHLIALLLALLMSACQPQTVVVEQVDGEFVVVTPQPDPNVTAIYKGDVRIGPNSYKRYKLIDKEDWEICKVYVRQTSGGASGVAMMDCRPMTMGEREAWK
jgi:hypothetical protein